MEENMGQVSFYKPMSDFLKFYERVEVPEFQFVDAWVPEQPSDIIFTHCKGFIIVNEIGNYFGVPSMPPDPISCFRMTAKSKRCYNSDVIRNHISQYLNYFEKYYDTDRELIAKYIKIKFMMDRAGRDNLGNIKYTQEDFIRDVCNYFILDKGFYHKIEMMNRDNYKLSLNYKNTKNPALQYNNKHALLLLEMMLVINMVIPLATHYASDKPDIVDIKDLLMRIYDVLLEKFEVDADIYNKMFETTSTNVDQHKIANKVLWKVSEIRGVNSTTHSLSTIDNILMQIVPKYMYCDNIIPYNYQSILTSLQYQITDIEYEYSFKQFSNNVRDDDGNSEFDKYESHLMKQDEAIYLQNVIAFQSTMDSIETQFGGVSDDEINFYIAELKKDNGEICNQFQKKLIFSLFYKYFEDTLTIKGCSQRDYIVLMIIAKRILSSAGMILLPNIIGGKCTKISTRNSINKKEMLRLENSVFYNEVKNTFINDQSMIDLIESNIATILSSEFKIIDFFNPNINGLPIEINSDCIIEEFLNFVIMIGGK